MAIFMNFFSFMINQLKLITAQENLNGSCFYCSCLILKLDFSIEFANASLFIISEFKIRVILAVLIRDLAPLIDGQNLYLANFYHFLKLVTERLGYFGVDFRHIPLEFTKTPETATIVTTVIELVAKEAKKTTAKMVAEVFVGEIIRIITIVDFTEAIMRVVARNVI